MIFTDHYNEPRSVSMIEILMSDESGYKKMKTTELFGSLLFNKEYTKAAKMPDY